MGLGLNGIPPLESPTLCPLRLSGQIFNLSIFAVACESGCLAEFDT